MGASVQTHIAGQYPTGGNVIGTTTQNRIFNVDTINVNDIGNYLRNKGLPHQAVSSFEVLKYVQNGAREQKEFQLKRDFARMGKIGVAVNRQSHSSMKIALIWDEFMVKFNQPNTVTQYIEVIDGPFIPRQASRYSRTFQRGLTSQQQSNIINTLQNHANQHNLAQKAVNALK